MTEAVVGVKVMLAAGAIAIVGTHLTIGDFVFVLIALAYIFSILRDWRPVKDLRKENAELRDRESASSQKVIELEAKVAALEGTRDFAHAFEPMTALLEQGRVEHKEMIAAINGAVLGLAANTAALGALAAGVHAGTIPASMEDNP